MTDRKQIRQSLKDARKALTSEQRWHKAFAATHYITQQSIFKRARRVGLYAAVAAECPTLPLAVAAENGGKQLYYPAIGLRDNQSMHFVRADTDSLWANSRYNIPEPVPGTDADIMAARYLDIVFLPLVGFDLDGNRLGMGAGYYDRCFAFRRHRKVWKRPLLIGLAYDCQQADRIPAEPWDVPLDGVATESGLQIFRQR